MSGEAERDDDPSTDFDDLPERIIVVPDVGGTDDDLEALAAEVAAEADVDEPEVGAGAPVIDLEVPDDPEEVEAELEALAAEVAAEDPAGTIDLDPPAEAEPGDAPAVDLAVDERDPDADPDAEPVDVPADEPPAVEPDQPPTEAVAAIDLDEVDLRERVHRDELDALVAQVAASQEPDPTVAPAPARSETPRRLPERDETGPGTLRPKVPEPVIAARTTSGPSRTRRTVSRVRALLGLVFVVLLAGVGLAGAIGAAVLLVVLVLSRAFGSGS